MTTHISKEELALMMPGTLYHYFKDEPEYLVPATGTGPGLFARVGQVLAGWMERRSEVAELAGLSDAQLQDIGLNRSDVSRVFDPDFAAAKNRDRIIGRAQTGRIATI